MTQDVQAKPQQAEPSGEALTIGTGKRRLVQHTQQAGLVGCILVLGGVFTVVNSTFAEQANIIQLLQASTLYFIVACASTLVLVGGGLDFSVGATYALGAVVAGLLMTHGVPWPLGFLLGIAVGVIVGIVNAFISVRLNVPPLIATLGTFFFATGLAYALTGGSDVFGFSSSFIKIGNGSVDGIPYLIFYAVIIGIAFHILLERTIFGYNVRATGGNRVAAANNGIRVARLDFWLYGISGAVAALAGILESSQLSTASPEAGGSDLTFQVVTAVIVGGTSLFGGSGTIFGSALGAILFAEINDGLQVVNVNPLYQDLFVGVILVGAVALDQYQRGRQFRLGR